MKGKAFWATAALVICAAVVISLVVGRPSGAKEADVQVDSRIVEADNAFAIDLFRYLGDDAKWSKNVFISPASIALALTMTYNGASGEVQEAMANTLRLKGMSLEEVNKANSALLANLEAPGAGIRLDIANSLWGRIGVDFQCDFLDRVREHFRAQITNLDFSDPGAADTVNAWIEQQTQDRIKQMLDRIDANAMLLLVNAVYFKGEWTEKFPAARTHDDEFTLSDGTKIMVPTMSRSGKFGYLQGDGFQAARLPYGDDRIAMYVFLPSENSNLAQLSRQLTAYNWKTSMSQFHSVEGFISLPKFKIEYSVNLNDPLNALGMGPAFAGSSTDWKPMTTVGPVAINRVLHKSFLEVNEEGSEAAASTVVEMALTAAPISSVRVVVDRPFFVAIRDDKTGVVLFAGIIADPGN